MTSCEVLSPNVSAMLVPLRKLVAGLSIRDRLPQIELAVGSDVTALVLCILEPLNEADEALLRTFADQWNVQWWVPAERPDTVYPFYPLDRELAYTLLEFDVSMLFKPTALRRSITRSTACSICSAVSAISRCRRGCRAKWWGSRAARR